MSPRHPPKWDIRNRKLLHLGQIDRIGLFEWNWKRVCP